MTMQTRVLITDDRPRSRSGLRALLDLRPEIVVGEAADGQEAVRLVAECQPVYLPCPARSFDWAQDKAGVAPAPD